MTHCNVWKNTFANPLLNAQEMKSILSLDNIVALMHFLYTQLGLLLGGNDLVHDVCFYPL